MIVIKYSRYHVTSQYIILNCNSKLDSNYKPISLKTKEVILEDDSITVANIYFIILENGNGLFLTSVIDYKDNIYSSHYPDQSNFFKFKWNNYLNNSFKLAKGLNNDKTIIELWQNHAIPNHEFGWEYLNTDKEDLIWSNIELKYKNNKNEQDEYNEVFFYFISPQIGEEVSLKCSITDK